MLCTVCSLTFDSPKEVRLRRAYTQNGASLAYSLSAHWNRSLAFSYMAAPEAEASFKKMSTVEMVDAADMIVRGTIAETWTEVDENGRIWTRAQINIIESYKGAGDARSIVVDQLGGEYGGVRMHDSAAQFSHGEEAVLSSTNFAAVNCARSPCSPGNGPFVWTPTRKPKSSSDSRSKPEKSTTIGSFLFHHLEVRILSLRLQNHDQ